jgi:hypothetical protein
MHFFINNPLRNCDMKLQILTDDMYLRIFVFTDCIHNVDSKCRRSVKIFIFRSNNLQLTIVCNKAIVNLMKPYLHFCRCNNMKNKKNHTV